MLTTQNPTPLGEVWMVLNDHRRLAKLLLIQGVSQRSLAAALGFKSHTYIGRLIRGEVKTLSTETAVGIALYLGVGVDDLFVARSTNATGRSVQRHGAA